MDLIKDFIALAISFYSLSATAQTEINTFKDCSAYLKNDSIVLENSAIKRIFRFNQGNLSTCFLVNKQSGKSWTLQGNQPDFALPFAPGAPVDASFKTKLRTETPQHAAHLEAEVMVTYKDIMVKRVFRIYPSTPAIACDTYLKGDAERWQQMAGTASSTVLQRENVNKIMIDRLPLSGTNWKVKSVEFFDATDHNNTLTQEYSRTAYRSEFQLRGNLLLMTERPSGEGLFWLKEAPVSGIQLDYPGFDFSVRFNEFKATGVGIAPDDLSDGNWVRGYSIVTGVAPNGEEGTKAALRIYQQHLKPANPDVDNMIMLNTWGDRGRDKNINETFILNEIALGAQLGITHLQMDDGWQTGRSGASAFGGGSLDSIWRNPNYWQPDPHKFPNGFGRIMAAAKKAGITISTWFNPSTDHSFKNWQKDAAVLINQYKEYGIYMWKIDGVRIEDKQAEINFRKMLDTVVESTGNRAVFNLDVTAGKRFGYNYFYEYGNLFLENRYTDFANYYPHFTLRNLWMLSKYLPPQRLQIEFLNKWRNRDKYPAGDLFAPDKYSFDYLFAITMPAQPLAWMEARNLPKEAFHTATLIKTYKKHWKEWHSGQIFPIGEEPSGISWTGFQSTIKDKSSGYVLVFREMTPRKEMPLELSRLSPGKYSFELIAGEGKNFNATVLSDNQVTFRLPNERSFAWYEYRLIQ